MPRHGETYTDPKDGSVWKWNERDKQWHQVQGPVINSTLQVVNVAASGQGTRSGGR